MSDDRQPLLHSSEGRRGFPASREGDEKDLKSCHLDWRLLLVSFLGTSPSRSRMKFIFLIIWWCIGIFIAIADDSFVLSTHGEIASAFQALSVGHWLVTGYNLGYLVSLPAVSWKLFSPCFIILCFTTYQQIYWAQYGRLYEIFGGKVALIAAYSVFGIGCLTTYVSSTNWHQLKHWLIMNKGAGDVNVDGSGGQSDRWDWWCRNGGSHFCSDHG